MAKLISKTYGDALFDAAIEKNMLDQVMDDAYELLDMLDSRQDFKAFIMNTAISEADKEKAVLDIFDGKADEVITGFLMIVIKKGRFSDLEGILNYYIERVKEYKKIGVAFVTSAVELSEDEKKQVKDKLLSVTKYSEFEINYTIDPDIIGGLVIRIGDRVFDNSIKNRIRSLSGQLMRIHLT